MRENFKTWTYYTPFLYLPAFRIDKKAEGHQPRECQNGECGERGIVKAGGRISAELFFKKKNNFRFRIKLISGLLPALLVQ
jgi:hypothetical protein